MLRSTFCLDFSAQESVTRRILETFFPTVVSLSHRSPLNLSPLTLPSSQILHASFFFNFSLRFRPNLTSNLTRVFFVFFIQIPFSMTAPPDRQHQTITDSLLFFEGRQETFLTCPPTREREKHDDSVSCTIILFFEFIVVHVAFPFHLV